jgi:hypothetical protein
MKSKPDVAAAGEAVRVATEKAAKFRRIADAEGRLMQVAKLRFKTSKKTWKVARKTAKRSAKRLKLAEKNLAVLEKHLKRAQAKTAKKTRVKSRAKMPVGRAKKSVHSKRPAAPVSLRPAGTDSAATAPAGNEEE